MLQIRIQKTFQEILSSKQVVPCLNSSLAMIFMLFFQFSIAQQAGTSKQSAANKQAITSPYNFSQLDQILATNNKALGGKLVTLVAKDGKIIYKNEAGEDFKMETPEHIGTSSKWLTAALVMTFVDKGELSLDDPVSKYLPIFSSYSKSYITLRHCLAEITGVEAEQGKVGRLLQKKKFATLEEEVNYYVAHKNIVTQPGKEFFYGDFAYNTLGRVLEVVAKKKTFSKLMQERITKPVGMKKTNFLNDRGAEDPAAGAVTTAGDYIRFMTMLLNNGEVNGVKVLSKEAIEEMEKVTSGSVPVKSAPNYAKDFDYGLGVWVQGPDKKGKSTVITCPGIAGTWPFIDRCRKYACIILTRQLDTEQNQTVFLQLKDEIDKQLASECN